MNTRVGMVLFIMIKYYLGICRAQEVFVRKHTIAVCCFYFNRAHQKHYVSTAACRCRSHSFHRTRDLSPTICLLYRYTSNVVQLVLYVYFLQYYSLSYTAHYCGSPAAVSLSSIRLHYIIIIYYHHFFGIPTTTIKYVRGFYNLSSHCCCHNAV